MTRPWTLTRISGAKIEIRSGYSDQSELEASFDYAENRHHLYEIPAEQEVVVANVVLDQMGPLQFDGKIQVVTTNCDCLMSNLLSRRLFAAAEIAPTRRCAVTSPQQRSKRLSAYCCPLALEVDSCRRRLTVERDHHLCVPSSVDRSSASQNGALVY